MGTKSVTTGHLSRRSLLRWTGAVGAGTALVGMTGCSSNDRAQDNESSDRIVWSACTVNCGSRCPLRLQVRDGVVTRVLPDDTGDDDVHNMRIRACPRGRSMRHQIYNPDRIQAPMKRVGKRGEAKFEEISWDEAFRTIGDKLKEVIAKYGNESVYTMFGTGVVSAPFLASAYASTSLFSRLMNLVGGHLDYYEDYSEAQSQAAGRYFWGHDFVVSNTFDDIANSKLVVLFGNNPIGTGMSGGGEAYVLEQMKEKYGTRVILVDPRYSVTAAAVADEWIPIKPSTDPALIAGLVHVILDEGLHDQEFLDTYTIGFDEDHMPDDISPGHSYRSYVMGEGPDKTPKTAEWAASKTGIPANTIIRLAREIALARPAMLVSGFGPQRHYSGVETMRAYWTLAAVTGNVGINGGGTGAREHWVFRLPPGWLPMPENQVKARIPVFQWLEAIERGPEMTALTHGVTGVDRLSHGIKFLWNYAGNALINNHSDANRTHRVLSEDTNCEMIVVVDTQLTASARYADILLPGTTMSESEALVFSESSASMGYYIYADKAIEPLHNSKTIYDTCIGIARELGVEQEFTEGRSQSEWQRVLLDQARNDLPVIPTIEELKQQGVWRFKNPTGPVVAYQSFRDDPVANPLPTPSGKMEIFSKQLWDINNSWVLTDGDKIPAIAEYLPVHNGPEDPKREKYPLQCIAFHQKGRAHTSYGNVDWLNEAHPMEVWINPSDAEQRGIGQGDLIQVFNDQGRIELPAKVTPRIAPQVVAVPHGGWYQPDADGVCRGGSINVLTDQRPVPLSKGNAQHTNLVQVEKV